MPDCGYPYKKDETCLADWEILLLLSLKGKYSSWKYKAGDCYERSERCLKLYRALLGLALGLFQAQ